MKVSLIFLWFKDKTILKNAAKLIASFVVEIKSRGPRKPWLFSGGKNRWTG